MSVSHVGDVFGSKGSLLTMGKKGLCTGIEKGPRERSRFNHQTLVRTRDGRKFTWKSGDDDDEECEPLPFSASVPPYWTVPSAEMCNECGARLKRQAWRVALLAERRSLERADIRECRYER